MKFILPMISALALASSSFAASVPTDAHACFLLIEGVGATTAVYSCDGKASAVIAQPSSTDAVSNMSSAISLFVKAGYKVISCQYVLGGSKPQYTCTFAK